MSDLFSGSLGRLYHSGGSRFFSTPRTIHVKQDYYINLNINRSFVTASLDGRLWLYGREGAYVLFALKWNENTHKLEMGSYSNIRDENIIARGNGYILSNKKIYSAKDNNTCLYSEALFDDNEQSRFLYSILRSSVLQNSGFDRLSGEAWGISDNNGNSEGYGFFNKDGFLRSIEFSYSVLPPVGDWFITDKFLLRNPASPLDDSYNGMKSLRPLIPLEFYKNNNPFYGYGYDNRNIQLIQKDGKIFARGVRNFGRAYILPAVFDEDGEPQEFYLYISPDYVCDGDNINDWGNISPIVLSGSLYGFLSEFKDSTSSFSGILATNDKLFYPDNSLWKEVRNSQSEDSSEENNNSSENKKIVVDIVQSLGLLLDDNGVTFLDDFSRIDCNSLAKWVAPADIIDFLDDNFIGASCDNLSITTNLNSQFYRTATDKKNLPITLSSFTNSNSKNICFAIHNSKNKNGRYQLAINEFPFTQQNKIEWLDIFKKALNIKMLTCQEKFISFQLVWDYEDDIFYPVFIISETLHIRQKDSMTGEYRDGGFLGYGLDSNGNLIYPARVNIETTFCFFDTTTDELIENHTHASGVSIINNDDYCWAEAGNLFIQPYELAINRKSNYIGYRCHYIYAEQYRVDNNGNPQYRYNSRSSFMPTVPIPPCLNGWSSSFLENNCSLSLQTFSLPYKQISTDQQSIIGSKSNSFGVTADAFAIFSEHYSNSTFAVHSPSLFSEDKENNHSGILHPDSPLYGYLFNFWNNNYMSNGISTKNLHAATLYDWNKNGYFVAYYSEFDNDTFNFNNELQRSVLS